MSPDQIVADEPRLWQPWIPKVGQRVRISISPECQIHWTHRQRDLIGDFNGRIGTVSGMDDSARLAYWTTYPGHTYLVILDTPVGSGQSDGVFAAIELEPVS